MIRVEHHDQVTVVKLDRGVTNALNLTLVQELAEALVGKGHTAARRRIKFRQDNTCNIHGFFEGARLL